MKKFNSIIEQLIEKYAGIIGNTEKIYIDGVGETVCKVDTGNNAFNVLHGVDIKQSGDSVIFTTVNNKRITKKVIDTATINIGSGIKEERPIITFDIKLGDKSYPNIKFTISNREENSEPVLLGKEFLSTLNKLIDINKDFTV